MVDEALLQDEGIQAWWAEAHPKLAQLRQVPQLLAPMLAQFRTERAATEQDRGLGPDAQAARYQAIRVAAEAAIRTIEQAAVGAKAALDALIRTGKASPPPADAQRALLDELQAQRAWQRALRLLDAQLGAAGAVHVVQQLTSEARAMQAVGVLQILREEAPAYLWSRRWGSAVPAVSQIVEAALQPYLPAKMRAAQDLERVLASGWLVTEGALRLAREEVTGGQAVAVLPGWAGDVIAIDEP